MDMIQSTITVELLGSDLEYIEENFSLAKENQEVYKAMKKEGWYDYQKEHIFPDTKTLAQIAYFFKMEFYQTLALLLKGEWEIFFSQEMGYKQHDFALKEVLLNQIAAQELKKTFKAGISFDSIIKALGGKKNCCEEHGYNSDTLKGLLAEMILHDFHLLPIQNHRLKSFSIWKNDENLLMSQGDAEQKSKFAKAKIRWMELHEIINELLLLRESRRVQNANIENRWMRIFGAQYLSLQEQVFRYHMIERRINLKHADCDLTEEDLLERLKEVEDEQQRQLRNLQFEVSLAPWLQKPGVSGSADMQTLHEYRKQSAKILKNLWMLLHPDKLLNNPQYQKLDEKQKKYLQQLSKDILAVKPEEIGYSDDQVGSTLRSLSGLVKAQEKVQAIFNLPGFDGNVDLMIQGENLEEKLQWLEKEILRLEEDIDQIKTEIMVLNSDKEIFEKTKHLEFPEQYEEIQKQLIKKSEEYKKKADELEPYLKSLFE